MLLLCIQHNRRDSDTQLHLGCYQLVELLLPLGREDSQRISERDLIESAYYRHSVLLSSCHLHGQRSRLVLVGQDFQTLPTFRHIENGIGLVRCNGIGALQVDDQFVQSTLYARDMSVVECQRSFSVVDYRIIEQRFAVFLCHHLAVNLQLIEHTRHRQYIFHCCCRKLRIAGKDGRDSGLASADNSQHALSIDDGHRLVRALVAYRQLIRIGEHGAHHCFCRVERRFYGLLIPCQSGSELFLKFCRHLNVEVLVFGHRERKGGGSSRCGNSVTRDRQLRALTDGDTPCSACHLYGTAGQCGHCRQVLLRQVVALGGSHRQRTYTVSHRCRHRACGIRRFLHNAYLLFCPGTDAGQHQQGYHGYNLIHIVFHIARTLHLLIHYNLLAIPDVEIPFWLGFCWSLRPSSVYHASWAVSLVSIVLMAVALPSP